MNKDKGKYLIFLHILLMVYSLSTVCSKMASRQEFLSFKFCLFYGGVVVLLGIYAVVWQQIIKKLPLTLAYANKAVTVFWGIVWGLVFFGEEITFRKIAGALIVIAGIAVYAFADNESEDPAGTPFDAVDSGFGSVTDKRGGGNE